MLRLVLAFLLLSLGIALGHPGELLGKQEVIKLMEKMEKSETPDKVQDELTELLLKYSDSTVERRFAESLSVLLRAVADSRRIMNNNPELYPDEVYEKIQEYIAEMPIDIDSDSLLDADYFESTVREFIAKLPNADNHIDRNGKKFHYVEVEEEESFDEFERMVLDYHKFLNPHEARPKEVTDEMINSVVEAANAKYDSEPEKQRAAEDFALVFKYINKNMKRVYILDDKDDVKSHPKTVTESQEQEKEKMKIDEDGDSQEGAEQWGRTFMETIYNSESPNRNLAAVRQALLDKAENEDVRKMVESLSVLHKAAVEAWQTMQLNPERYPAEAYEKLLEELPSFKIGFDNDIAQDPDSYDLRVKKFIAKLPIPDSWIDGNGGIYRDVRIDREEKQEELDRVVLDFYHFLNPDEERPSDITEDIRNFVLDAAKTYNRLDTNIVRAVEEFELTVTNLFDNGLKRVYFSDDKDKEEYKKAPKPYAETKRQTPLDDESISSDSEDKGFKADDYETIHTDKIGWKYRYVKADFEQTQKDAEQLSLDYYHFLHPEEERPKYTNERILEVVFKAAFRTENTDFEKEEAAQEYQRNIFYLEQGMKRVYEKDENKLKPKPKPAKESNKQKPEKKKTNKLAEAVDEAAKLLAEKFGVPHFSNAGSRTGRRYRLIRLNEQEIEEESERNILEYYKALYPDEEQPRSASEPRVQERIIDNREPLDFSNPKKIEARNKFQLTAGFLETGRKKEYIDDDEPYEEFENREMVWDNMAEVDALLMKKQQEHNLRKENEAKKRSASKYQQYKDKFKKEEL